MTTDRGKHGLRRSYSNQPSQKEEICSRGRNAPNKKGADEPTSVSQEPFFCELHCKKEEKIEK